MLLLDEITASLDRQAWEKHRKPGNLAAASIFLTLRETCFCRPEPDRRFVPSAEFR